MADAVYLTCALASVGCMVLLMRGYWRTKTRLLLWSGLCFAGLSANNVLLFLDNVIFPHVNLSVWRGSAALVGLLLLYGLIWDIGHKESVR
jgi:hypothetical protein